MHPSAHPLGIAASASLISKPEKKAGLGYDTPANGFQSQRNKKTVNPSQIRYDLQAENYYSVK